MILFEQNYYIFATLIPISIIFILKASACAISDGNTHLGNGNKRAESTAWKDGIEHPVNHSRKNSGIKDGYNKHERAKISETGKKKSEIGNKKHDESNNRPHEGNNLHNGNILRHGNILRDEDNYFAGKPEGGNAKGEIDVTESYAEMVKNLTTADKNAK